MQLKNLIQIAKTLNRNVLKDNRRDKFLEDKYNMSARHDKKIKDKPIEYDFQSLPYKEYGYLDGKLENTSVDSKIGHKSRVSFYIGEAFIR
ncbi:hypothetical protein [Clostridium sporogenes]|uniref:hypothetical protein n=1 Tax=Clostridium sporogenes TaxID=1509 RepID=UPI003DA484E5